MNEWIDKEIMNEFNASAFIEVEIQPILFTPWAILKIL